VTAPFELPTLIYTGLHTEAVTSGLKQICTPIEQAHPGDIVAVEIAFNYNGPALEVSPITDLYTLVDKQTLLIRKTPFHELPEPHQKELGVILMTMQSKGIYTGSLNRISRRMAVRENRSKYFEMIAMPHAAIVTQEEYNIAIFESYYPDGDFDQSAIDEAILAIHSHLPDSAHEVIQMHEEFNQLLKIVNNNVPMPSPRDIYVNEDLVLPDIDGIGHL
jgi:hypothetical protein